MKSCDKYLFSFNWTRRAHGTCPASPRQYQAATGIYHLGNWVDEKWISQAAELVAVDK